MENQNMNQGQPYQQAMPTAPAYQGAPQQAPPVMQNQAPYQQPMPNPPQYQYQAVPQYQQPYPQQVVVVQKKSNGIGTAGFVLALISLFFGWIAVVGWLLWFLGTLFSFIGLFKKPRGLAIAVFIISFIDVIVIAGLLFGLGLGSFFF